MAKEAVNEISLKNTKTEILEALNDALKREKELKEIKANPIEEQKKKKTEEIVKETKQNVENNIFSNELKEKFNKLEIALSEEEKRLKELYDVEKELSNLTIAVNAHKDLMINLEKKEKEAEETYSIKTKELEKEYNKKEKELHENYELIEKNLKKERDRENEEYNYKLKRERNIANDEWATLKQKREAEILEKEKEINTLLEGAKSNKEKYEELENKVNSIPQLLEDEYKKGANEKEKELEKDFSYKTSLKESEYKNIIDRQNDKIEALTKELEKSNSINSELQKKLDKSYDQIKELATKTVEANGGVKILNNSQNDNK